MGITATTDAGVAEIVLDKPPVNAFTVADWYAIADAVTAAGRDPAVTAVVLRAEGRAFCAGVDIKEIQAEGDVALVGANRGCYAAFNAVYDCQVPVVAAVQGYCLGGGIGLVGNADIVVAATDAVFGLPEVDRGALGAATHLSRLVPQQVMRLMVYTCRNLSAEEMARYGALLDVVPREALRETALGIARDIAARNGYVIRRAKESLNGIDPVDVHRSYRFEQGFTYELHVSGVADEHRAAFVEKRARQDSPAPSREEPARG
jgi:enoyl-CoA hydratase